MIIAAFAGPTDRSRAIAIRLNAALDERQMKRAEVAAHMKLASDKQVIRQLAGQEPMNLHRIAELPDDVWIAWIDRIADWLGCKLLTPRELDLLAGAAQLGAKRMARMGMTLVSERKRA